jgi:LPXTG-site transpeptidase (sortase) family protein
MDFTKKPAVGRPLLKVAFVALSAVMLFYLANGLYERQVGNLQTKSTPQYSKGNKQILGIKTQKENQSLPIRLKIPSINVDASIQYVGLTSKGAMEVPNNIVDVGWFDMGPRPGENGSAVIAGHFNGENGENGVFANLYKLKKGDKLYVEDSNGATISFTVRETRTYDPGYADDVFSGSGSAHLNLITCDGVWDKNKNSYNKRLVVFTDALVE